MIFKRRHNSARGFTLLEVMISLGILAVALMAIGDLNGGAVRMHAYAKRLTVAVQLARGKLLDIQELLRKEGLSDFSKEYRGTFEDEGWPEFKWSAQIIKPDFDLDTTKLMSKVGGSLGMDQQSQGNILGQLGLGGLGGANGSTGSSSSLPSGPTPAGGALGGLGPMAGLVDGQMKGFSEIIKNTVREVKLTISWKSGAQEESFDVVTHLVTLPGPPTPQQPVNTTGQPNPTGMGTGMGVPGPNGPLQQVMGVH